jgi:outer membrane lipoprotein-sorting protein
MHRYLCTFPIIVLAAIVAAPVATAADTDADALRGLQEHLAALKDVKTLTAKFICEKRLAMLDSPLVSTGRLWIRKSDDKGAGGAVRFSTDKPYISELILVDGKVHGRSQHENEWTTTNQSTRPGLSAVMVQLGGWSTGDAGKLTDMYSVARAAASAKIPPPPENAAGVKIGNEGVDIFVLTPTNKDLAIAVKSIEVSLDRSTHQLLSIQITTAQDDVTRYWFHNVQLNAALAADIFQPAKAAPSRGDAK